MSQGHVLFLKTIILLLLCFFYPKAVISEFLDKQQGMESPDYINFMLLWFYDWKIKIKSSGQKY